MKAWTILLGCSVSFSLIYLAWFLYRRKHFYGIYVDTFYVKIQDLHVLHITKRMTLF